MFGIFFSASSSVSSDGVRSVWSANIGVFGAGVDGASGSCLYGSSPVVAVWSPDVDAF